MRHNTIGGLKTQNIKIGSIAGARHTCQPFWLSHVALLVVPDSARFRGRRDRLIHFYAQGYWGIYGAYSADHKHTGLGSGMHSSGHHGNPVVERYKSR